MTELKNTTMNDLNARFSNLFPVGGAMSWDTITPPSSNWLLCDGSAVSRITYSELFSVIGTIYGSGDGLTTFNLPNPVKKFFAGVDDSHTLILSIGNFNHTHTEEAHRHDLGGHNHGIVHYHSLDTHNHSMNHNHGIPQHYHDFQNHTHTLAHVHTATTGGPSSAPTRNYVLSNTIAASGGHTHTITFNTTVGGSGAPSTNTTGGISSLTVSTYTNNTTNASGNTSTYNFNTGTNIDDTGDSSEANTTSNNPPYLACYWMIRC